MVLQFGLTFCRRLKQARASKMPPVSRPMIEIDQFMSALFLLALLLYLVPSVFRLGEGRIWFQRGAILTLGIAIAIAVTASVMWFVR